MSGGVGTAADPRHHRPDRRRRRPRTWRRTSFQVVGRPEQSSPTVAPDHVISTNPPIGTTEPVGTDDPHHPVVGRRPFPTSSGSAQQTPRRSSRRPGFTVEDAHRSRATRTPTGNVIRTDPPAGTSNVTGRQRRSNMFVSTGPSSVTVPPVVGFTLAKAEDTLRKDNLQAGVTLVPTDVEDRQRQGASQNPASGVQVQPQTVSRADKSASTARPPPRARHRRRPRVTTTTT